MIQRAPTKAFHKMKTSTKAVLSQDAEVSLD